MVQIIWEKWFEIGHNRIDSEHKTFFDILKSIDSDIQNGVDRLRVLRSLEELRLYTEFHFVSEENLMEDVKFPDIRAHRQGHKKILTQVGDYIDDIRRGMDRFEELVTFLYEWFCTHTVNEDIKIALHISKLKANLDSISC